MGLSAADARAGARRAATARQACSEARAALLGDERPEGLRGPGDAQAVPPDPADPGLLARAAGDVVSCAGTLVTASSGRCSLRAISTVFVGGKQFDTEVSRP